ncbi:MAG TPA: homogentisate 1,2-dioxygenase, partial [Marinobacter sp.]|nr:homogentisate 1,2-dioxygenase [Marinobacter sp.]
MPPQPSSDALIYQSGFGNEFSTEALPDALPVGQNSPQKVPYGLYTELLSGTAFTVPRAESRRTWMYRIKPSANHPEYHRLTKQVTGREPGPINPNRLRWNPFDVPSEPTDFLDGLTTIAATSPAEQTSGVSVHLYQANVSMTRAFFNADGEWLIVPQQG